VHADWPAENILLALLCERPMHGYELAQTVRNDAALRAIWRIERSEVYFLLRKLVSQGHIIEHGEAPGAGPKRLIYAPTPQGEAALQAWLDSPEPRPRNLRTALLARIYLALRRDPGLALEIIAAQREQLVKWLENEQARAYSDEIVKLVHRFRAAQVEAMVLALNDLERTATARSTAPTQQAHRDVTTS
jgi:DNA-binding PadR family transcriptional regulator